MKIMKKEFVAIQIVRHISVLSLTNLKKNVSVMRIVTTKDQLQMMNYASPVFFSF